MDIIWSFLDIGFALLSGVALIFRHLWFAVRWSTVFSLGLAGWAFKWVLIIAFVALEAAGRAGVVFVLVLAISIAGQRRDKTKRFLLMAAGFTVPPIKKPVKSPAPPKQSQIRKPSAANKLTKPKAVQQPAPPQRTSLSAQKSDTLTRADVRDIVEAALFRNNQQARGKDGGGKFMLVPVEETQPRPASPTQQPPLF